MDQNISPNSDLLSQWPGGISAGPELGKRSLDSHNCNCRGNLVTAEEGVDHAGRAQFLARFGWNPNQERGRDSVTTTWQYFF